MCIYKLIDPGTGKKISKTEKLAHIKLAFEAYFYNLKGRH